MRLADRTCSLYKNDCPSPFGRHRFKPFAAQVEFLESRVLLSVSATTLRPAFYSGAKSTFEVSGAFSETEIITDGGAEQFGGHNAERIHESTDNMTLGTSTSTTIDAAFTSAGFVSYGESSTTTSASAVVQTETVDSPYLVEIPSSLTAGKAVVSRTTSTGTQTLTVAGANPITTTTTNVLTITITLASNTMQSVTVPAGTFKAYQINETTAVRSESTREELWYAPQVGEIKGIIGTGEGQITEVLTEYTRRPTGLATSLSGSLTDSTVETTPLEGSEKITFTATGDAIAGIASAAVVLSPNSNSADSVFTLATITTSLNLNHGQHETLGLHLPKTIPASVVKFPEPPKTFHVLIQVVDTDGMVATELTGLTLTVAAPEVDITGSFITLPKLVVSGKPFTFTMQIANSSDANVPAMGTLQIDFETSPEEGSDFLKVGTSIGNISLSPGQTRDLTFTPHFVISLPDRYLRVVLDPGMVFDNDVDRRNNDFETVLDVTR